MLKVKFEFPGIDPDLNWTLTNEEVYNEFFWYLDHPKGELTLRCNRNKIVKLFQQDTFYKKEKELWRDDKIKRKLILNRMKYLNKKPEELTTYDILSGFKKSAMWYGYSGFNPQLCKWFYQWVEDNVGISMKDQVCYDPCGGWGNRMLGSTEIKKYIYNDLSAGTFDGVKRMKDVFEFFNAELHNKDARTFIPDDQYNVMFTCPPYYNLEEYECGGFRDMDDFRGFMNSLYDKYLNKDSCMVFGMVMREDLMTLPDPDYKFELSNNRAVHLNGETKHQNKEYLYIWIKKGDQ